MRTIKFRGQRIDNGEWVYGFLYELPLESGNVCMILTTDNIHKDNSIEPQYHLAFTLWKDLFVVDSSTVGQFTDMCDKNGNEIYEGDIVKWEFPDYDSCTGWRGTVKDVCKVTFEYGSFRINAYPYNLGSCEDFFEDKETYGLEVIGNIYDNPELLKN